MKPGVPLIFVLAVQFASAQKSTVSFSSIDMSVTKIESPSPADLAAKLTHSYKTDIEKTRAIFSWIAQHISYGVKPSESFSDKDVSSQSVTAEGDTSTTLTPLNELVSEDVLKKRTALCYGYSRLFKCLCDHAGIPCEIINGYGRGDLYRMGNNFHTNHSWNAVWLDSTWQLVDVTWASGYFTYNSNEFIRHFDDQYFLTPPEQFALDHFPDDLKWSLLQQPPTPREFLRSPYKGRCFVKYNIIAYSPAAGVIYASVGDTINFTVQTNLTDDRNIGGGSLEDTTNLLNSPAIAYCTPVVTDKANIIHYKYVVHSANEQWLQLVYNDDMILRYRLEINDEKAEK